MGGMLQVKTRKGEEGAGRGVRSGEGREGGGGRGRKRRERRREGGEDVRGERVPGARAVPCA